MSTLTIEQALTNVDATFRDKIIETYKEIKSRYSKALYNQEFDPAGLSTGKFCETVYRFLQQTLTDSFTPFGTHITNFNDGCNNLIRLPVTSGNESLRVIIPRALQFLYTMRGKRGIGHVGGDVEANKIDTKTIVRLADWVVCELIRLYHALSLEEAQAIVDAIAEKHLPSVWSVAGKKRVLLDGLDSKKKTLLLMYNSTEGFEFEEDLCNWVEYSNPTVFRNKVLKPLHDDKLIELDSDEGLVYLSPKGTNYVEQKILAKSL